MKLTQYSRKVMTNGGESSKFTAEMNAAFFAVSSDTMYQYKLAAVIRENCCNAYDSHIEAGIEDEPFHVTLPNDFNPNLTIEDFGVGLDDNGVRNVFSSYFKSTKNNSNVVTGGFGIGAKSTFAYSDTFEIVARKDGMERTYVAFIGEDGIPEVQLFSEKETGHRNGVRIKIPVQKEDFKRVIGEARVILSFFPTTPTVTGGDGIFEPLVSDLHEQEAENGFALIPIATGSDLYSGHVVYVLLNNVLYPIPRSVYGNISNTESINLVANSRAIVLKFEDGTLPPAATRESLSLKEDTKELIKNSIESIINAKIDEFQEKIDQILHPSDAIAYVDKNFGFRGFNKFKYRGKHVGYYRNREYTIPGAHYHEVRMMRNGPKRKQINNKFTASYTMRNLRERMYIVYRLKGEDETPIKNHIAKFIRLNDFRHKTTFIVLDGCPANRPERVKQLMNLPDAVVIDNLTLKEEVKKARVKSTITYDTGEKRDTTIYARSVDNDGDVQPVEHIDVTDSDTQFYWIMTGEEEDVTPPSTFGDNVMYIVANSNNHKKIGSFGIQSIKELAEKVVDDNPDLVTFYEMKWEFDHTGLRMNTRFHDMCMTVSTDKEIMKCKKLHDQYLKIKRSLSTISIGCPYVKAELRKRAKDRNRKKYGKIAQETNERIEMIFGQYKGCVSGISSQKEHEIIRMIDFCYKKGFNAQTNQ